MGMFSWKCSDTGNALLSGAINTNRLKPNWTKKAYLLVPKEFGGGAYLVDEDYDGYGGFFDFNTGRKVDAYELLGIWNGLEVPGDPDASRGKAIDLYYTPADPSKSPYMAGNYNSPKVMKYPLKIVQRRCAYEDAEPCTDDPNQGCGEPK